MKGLFKGFNLYISIGCLFSIIIIIITQFVLNEIPEYFNGGARLGNILFNISMSYIVSFIFYIVLVYLPEEKKLTYIKKHIILLINDIEQINNSVKDNMKRTTGNTANMNDFTDIKNVMSKILANDLAPIVAFNSAISSYTWKQYLELMQSQIKDKCNGLFVYMPYLDPRLVSLLSNMIYSPFFKQVDMLKGAPVSQKTTIEYLSKSYIEFNEILRQLNKYK
ncbi:hypothetical protein BSK66_12540 [Paenibacillus odorifer]|uniref:Uncharacterized protein n=1 Tax=Paenibacillus odorifer TaxID=189426 RepID=A0A1R0XAF9_9BACL|nr:MULTISPECIES: hypothetical protein [Paenibacillus]ETT53909.1 hypothetical protein C171_20669 [Paenibacillus sp. FSL H8-237]OMD31925.1 hypothetical protein BJP51_16895 [Paenibacillus odorifer]OME58421.1 hypothetical protein BSK66_12540 [Paenibacillus odorifer]